MGGENIQPPLEEAWRAQPADGGLSALSVGRRLAVANAETALVALDPQGGDVRWTIPRRSGALTPPAMAGEGGRAIVVFTEGSQTGGRAVAVDASARRRLWTVPLPRPGAGGPTIEGGRVFAGTREQSVYGIDLARGRVAWTVRTRGTVDTAPAVAAGKVFVVAEDQASGRATLYALQAGSGKTVWSFSPPGFAVGASSVTVGEERVYAGFGDLAVRALDPETGKVEWSQRVRAPFSAVSTPAFAESDLYVTDRGGGLYRLDGDTGEKIWDYQFASSSRLSAPLVAGDIAYVGLDDGTLAAVDTVTGNLVWRSGRTRGPLGALAPTGDLLLVPSAAEGGGVRAFRHDEAGALVDIPSPTRLRMPLALANFAVAFVLVLLLLLSVFRVALGSRRSPPGPRPTEGLGGTG